MVALDSDANGWRSAATRLGTFLLALLPASARGLRRDGAGVAVGGHRSAFNPPARDRYFSHFFEKPWQELFSRPLDPTARHAAELPACSALTPAPGMFLVLGGLGARRRFVCNDEKGQSNPVDERCCSRSRCPALLPIVTTIVTRPAMYNGIRHFVFVLPPLAVAGGLCANIIVEYLQRFGRTALAAAAAIFVFGISLPVIAMIRLHPYEYVDFNEIAGGVRGAQSRFMLDYWGLRSRKRARTCAHDWPSVARIPRPGGAGRSQCAAASASRTRARRYIRSRPGTRRGPTLRSCLGHSIAQSSTHR